MGALTVLLGYVRVSTAEQQTSLAEQERVIRGTAIAQGFGQFDMHIYRDEDVSGGMPLSRRPQGRLLFDEAKRGDIVMAAKLDRMFRDTQDALMVYKSFKDRGVHLVLYDMGLEPVTKDDGMAKMFFTLLCAFAEMERSRIRERLATGKRIKREKGGHAGGKVKTGFKVVGSGREATVVPDETEQAFLAAIVELKDYRFKDVCTEITARGFRTRKGKPHDPKTIWRLLPEDSRVKIAYERRKRKREEALHATAA